MRKTTDRGKLPLAPGEQVLVSVPSMGSPLSALPDGAFENLLVVSATAAPDEVESLVERRGGDPQKVGVVPVTGSPGEYHGPVWTTDPVDRSDLTGVSIGLSKALEYVEAGGWVVFDNVNVLLMYGHEEHVYRLLESVTSNARATEARGVYCTVPEAVTDETCSRLAVLRDGRRPSSSSDFTERLERHWFEGWWIELPLAASKISDGKINGASSAKSTQTWIVEPS